MNLLLPLDLERSKPVRSALVELSVQENIEKRGAVYTKPKVVEGILDLCGYTADRELPKLRFLEPSFGDGDFLLPAVQRLLNSCRRFKLPPSEWHRALSDSIFAVELHTPTFERTRNQLIALIENEGLSPESAKDLVSGWLRQDDFLLTKIQGRFDVVAGNPPYVRQERVPNSLLKEYKWLYSTLYDRADLYVLFFERSLDLLTKGGVLGFICANRWVKNKYGGPLREKIASAFNLDIYIDLEQVDAFHHRVDAYPAITIIRSTQPKNTAIVTGGRNGERPLEALMEELKNSGNDRGSSVSVVTGLTNGKDPWLLDAPALVEVVRHFEARFPTLEQSGAKVGIGVATGCDKVYIGPFDKLPVEKERKLPLALASDQKGQQLQWSGQGLVNPWLKSGRLASLEEFPKFALYMKKHESMLRGRHTAKQNPGKWYKTIDRVYPDLTYTPKLLIPDIKGEATVVYDPGHYYPHHNLYVITSNQWDLQVLQALLRSSVALMFVAAYCVRMSGGFLRFQAQYLRRIRVPRWQEIDAKLRDALRGASTSGDQDEIDRIVAKAYGISDDRLETIQIFADEARVSKVNP